MVDWETVGIISLILPVDAVVVSFLMAWWLKRMLRNVWKQEVKKRFRWPWEQWSWGKSSRDGDGTRRS